MARKKKGATQGLGQLFSQMKAMLGDEKNDKLGEFLKLRDQLVAGIEKKKELPPEDYTPEELARMVDQFATRSVTPIRMKLDPESLDYSITTDIEKFPHTHEGVIKLIQEYKDLAALLGDRAESLGIRESQVIELAGKRILVILSGYFRSWVPQNPEDIQLSETFPQNIAEVIPLLHAGGLTLQQVLTAASVPFSDDINPREYIANLRKDLGRRLATSKLEVLRLKADGTLPDHVPNWVRDHLDVARAALRPVDQGLKDVGFDLAHEQPVRRAFAIIELRETVQDLLEGKYGAEEGVPKRRDLTNAMRKLRISPIEVGATREELNRIAQYY